MKKYLLCSCKGFLLCALLFFSMGTAQVVIFSENMGSPSGTISIASNTFQNSIPITFGGTADVRNTTTSIGGYTTASGAGNVFFTDSSSSNFIISGINTSLYNNLVLKLGHHKSTIAGNNELRVEVSADGLVWNSLAYSRATGSGTANWIVVTPTGSIPSTSNLRLRFTNTSTSTQFRIDDVSLTGDAIISPKPEPTNFPTGFSCGTSTSSSIPLTWTDATGVTLPDGYLIKWGTTSYEGILDPADGTAVADGANAHNVLQGIGSHNVIGLSASTPYFFKIWSYTNSGDKVDYKLVNEPQTTCNTLAASCVFIEDFENIPIPPTPGQYLSRSWAGSGGTWNATEARSDQTLNGKAICFRRTGILTSPNITGGIGDLTFKAKFPFTESNGNLEIRVNGSLVRTIAYVEMNKANSVTFSINNINISGNVVITMTSTYTSGTDNRYVIDDIAWTCYSGTPQPNINIQGNSINILNSDITPSTADDTNFGAAIIAGTNVEKTFTIQNNGSGTLTLDSPAVVLLDGLKGFTVSAQTTINPMSGFTAQTFKVNFNNSAPGTYTETVMIRSNDPDTPVYSFDVKAIVLMPIISTDKTALSGFTYAFSQGPSDTQSFVVNGSNLAAGITVTASANWEISTNLSYDVANVSPWSTITVTKTAGNAVTNKQIHVRLKDGLAQGSYTGTISLSSTSATPQTLTVSGTVTAGVAEIKVTGSGTTVTNGTTSPTALNNTLFASQNIGNQQTKSFVITNFGGATLTINTISISAGDGSSFTVLNPPSIGTVLSTNQTATFDIRFSPSSIGTKTATISIANTDPNDNPYTFAVQGGATFCASPGDIVVTQQGFETNSVLPQLAYTTTNIGTPGPRTGFCIGGSGNSAKPKNNNLYSEGTRGYRIQGNDPIGEIPSGIIFTFDPIDTSSYTGIDLSFKVAGFSLGSATNGMDCNGTGGGDACETHQLRLDYVLVEVSADNGVTWFQQAKVVTGDMQVAWSFGSTGTTTNSRNYAADNNLTYFSSSTTTQYSGITIHNIPAVSQLQVRITAQDNSINESWILDDIKITSAGLVPKVWDGSGWLPSAPQPSDKAIINADYATANHGTFKVCQCEIKTGKKLTVSENTAITVTDVLRNDGIILVESGAGLVQSNDANTNAGTGTFTAERKIHLPSSDRNQYNYLIAPVVNGNLKNGIYNGVSAPYVLYYNQTNNYFYESSGAYIPGRALAVKEPSLGTVSGTETKAVFTGIPVNGPLAFNAENSNPGINSPATAIRGYHLIGNPYPSNMDLITFYNLNGGEAGGISSTFYFWDNTANNIFEQGGSDYSGNAYATFNAVDNTGTKATGYLHVAGTKKPTRYVNMAQGFMSRVLSAAKTIQFSNSVRKTDDGVPFFGKTIESTDRFWLNMIAPNNLVSNMAVIYFEEGNNSFTADDSRSLGGSDEIYSMVDEEPVTINGKSRFSLSDRISLGTVHFSSGNYRIELDQVEGLFAAGQNIYLKDTQTGLLSNLSQGSYTFSANAGESTGRFEIIYVPETVLASGENANDPVIVYWEEGDFIVKAHSNKITRLELYDMTGRLIYKDMPNKLQASLDASIMVGGVYLLKVDQGGKVSSRKIVK